MIDREQKLKRGRQLHQQGHLAQALEIYQAVLEDEPQNADALYLSGLIHYRSGRTESAVDLIRRALHIEPSHALANASLGQIYQDRSEHLAALSYFEKAVSASPVHPEFYNGLGVSLMAIGELERAEKMFGQGLAIKPDMLAVLVNLGNLQRRQGRFDEARKNYRSALQINPDFAPALNNLGVLHQQQGRLESAARILQAALAHQPDNAEVLSNLGAVFNDAGKSCLALERFRQALDHQPDFVPAIINCGMLLQGMGDHAEARELLDRALTLDPGSRTAQWARCFAELEFVYADEQARIESRNRYHRSLKRLICSYDLSDAKNLAEASETAGVQQPFLLAYQGENDRELQSMYGQFVSEVFNKMEQRLSQKKRRPGKPRIGMVSAFFYDHSNWKIPMQGWMAALKDEFEIYAYHTGVKQDARTMEARALSHVFRDQLGESEFVEAILGDDIDLLIYPEVGMHPLTLKLASRRLAQVQCVSWGHPVTSGLPTMDYFISSEYMEPENSQVAYTEELLVLPGLSFTWEPQSDTCEPASLEALRNRLNLEQDEILYLCVQNLSKYLPRYDRILVEICAQVPRARLLFIATDDKRTQMLQKRLASAFERADIDFESQVDFIPRLNKEEYRCLNQLADVFLDTPEWSGCNSSLEALISNLPVVTVPGRWMRGRHSAAIYQQIQTMDLVAKDAEEYIRLAVRLGVDRAFRQAQVLLISEAKHRLVGDDTPSRELARRIPELIERAQRDD